MKNLQRAGGLSALMAAATYLFAMALMATVLAPLEDPSLGFEEYRAFLSAHRALAFAWDFVPYIVNGACLAVLALALHERLKPGSPRLAAVATAFGFIWIALVFLSGFISIHGDDTVLALAAAEPAQAETLRIAMDTLTAGIDSSDKILGCLWVGLASLAGLRAGSLPKGIGLLGLAIGSLGILGATVPALSAVSYAFGIGIMLWWIALGNFLLSRRAAAAKTCEAIGVSP